MTREIDSQNYFFTYTMRTQKKGNQIYAFRNPKTTRFLCEQGLESRAVMRGQGRKPTIKQQQPLITALWAQFELQRHKLPPSSPGHTKHLQNVRVPCTASLKMCSLTQNVLLPSVKQKENLNWWEWSTKKQVTFPNACSIKFLVCQK